MLNNLGGRVQYGTGLTKADGGNLPQQHSIKEIFGNRVISADRSAKDRSMNEDIQEKGAHFGGSAKPWPSNDGVEPFFNAQEYLWYKAHKK